MSEFGRVAIGSVVLLSDLERYTIGAQPSPGSPLGQALIGRWLGEEIEAQLPSGTVYRARIIEVDGYTSLAEAAAENHRQRLAAAHLPYAGVREASANHHRVTHCWRCKRHLDNMTDVECCACGWILCACGACGCGYG